MTRNMCLFSVVTLALMAIVGGCSKSADSGESAIKKTVNSYHQAVMDKDLVAAKALISSESSKKMLDSMIDIRSDGLKRGGLPKIVTVSVNGDTAVATCKFGPTEQGVDLVKANGKWLIK